MNSLNESNGDRKKAKEINLKELFVVIKRRFWIIAMVSVLAGIVGVLLNNTSVTPMYMSSSRIIIGADEESRKTLQVIVKDSIILEKVVKELGLTRSAEALAGQITVASVESSQVVSISVVDPDPSQAAKIADTTAQIFRDEVPKIVGKDYIRLLSNAKVNTISINPKNNNKILFLIIGGLAIGIGIAFLFESLDDKIRKEDDIESLLGLPVLGRIPKVNKRMVKKKTKSMKFELEPRSENIDL
ncbi:YveK family protein [Neobacillus sp. KR4-4]|uniref:YveK family protein n=1 Tax=Neobacillus sp. KR4-4 TaxID=3344872 RepID=UPI0035CB6684